MCKAFELPDEAQLAAAFSWQYVHFEHIVRTDLDANTFAFALIPVDHGVEFPGGLLAIFHTCLSPRLPNGAVRG